MAKNTELAVIEAKDYAVMTMPPKELEQLLYANAGTLGVTERDFERIKLPSQGATNWTIATLDGEVTVPSFDVIVASFKDVRAYWHESFSKTGGGPPDCKSDNAIEGIGDPGGVCAKCKFSQFGTAIADDGSQGKGQACNQYRLLFGFRHDNILPCVVQLPATSIDACRGFFMRLAGARLKFSHVVIRIGLEPDKNDRGIKYSKATFRRVSEVPVDERPRVDALSASLDQVLGKLRFTGEGMQPGDPV